MRRMTRRQALAAGGGAVAATAIGATSVVGDEPGAYDGPHQRGIATPRQAHLTLAAFDVRSPDPGDLRRLLTAWTLLVESARSTTVTIGIGASMFAAWPRLAGRAPRALAPLEDEDGLDPARSGGDLLAAIGSDDRQDGFRALHELTNAALGIATPRWVQHGFDAPRNVLGFRDGGASAREPVVPWVRPTSAGAGWMTDGTYLVYRRMRARLDVWDVRPRADQELAIGRRKESGDPITGAPDSAHVRVMRHARMLRRSYNYDDGVVGATLDAGLLFLCFTADPRRHFVPARRAMLAHDDVSRYVVATAGGLFAIPPASHPGQPLAGALLA